MSTTKGRVDQATWDKLLEAYRDDPGNHSAAARHAGVQRRTARHAWDLGYPDRPWGSKSIRDMIRDEAELARSRLQLEDEKQELEEDRELLELERDREAARQRSITTRIHEGQLVTGVRTVTMNALASASKASEGLTHIMSRLSGALIALASGEAPLTAKEINSISNIMRRYSSTLRELAQAGQVAMQMERLYLGEPTNVIGIISDLDAMPLDDLVKMSGLQGEVLKRAANHGLVVLDGGLGRKPGDGN